MPSSPRRGRVLVQLCPAFVDLARVGARQTTFTALAARRARILTMVGISHHHARTPPIANDTSNRRFLAGRTNYSFERPAGGAVHV
jgi:hypothetical protein